MRKEKRERSKEELFRESERENEKGESKKKRSCERGMGV